MHTVDKSVLLRSSKVMILQTLRNQILKEIHDVDWNGPYENVSKIYPLFICLFTYFCLVDRLLIYFSSLLILEDLNLTNIE